MFGSGERKSFGFKTFHDHMREKELMEYFEHNFKLNQSSDVIRKAN